MSRIAQLVCLMLVASLPGINRTSAATFYEQDWELYPQSLTLPHGWVASDEGDFISRLAGVQIYGVNGSKAAYLSMISSASAVGVVAATKSIAPGVPEFPANVNDLSFTADLIGMADVDNVAVPPVFQFAVFQEYDSSHIGREFNAILSVTLPDSNYHTHGGPLSGFTQTGAFDPTRSLSLEFSIVKQTAGASLLQTVHFDNVKLATVPEPSTIALALLSVPSLFALRRRLR